MVYGTLRFGKRRCGRLLRGFFRRLFRRGFPCYGNFRRRSFGRLFFLFRFRFARRLCGRLFAGNDRLLFKDFDGRGFRGSFRILLFRLPFQLFLRFPLPRGFLFRALCAERRFHFGKLS